MFGTIYITLCAKMYKTTFETKAIFVQQLLILRDLMMSPLFVIYISLIIRIKELNTDTLKTLR